MTVLELSQIDKVISVAFVAGTILYLVALALRTIRYVNGRIR